MEILNVGSFEKNSLKIGHCAETGEFGYNCVKFSS